MTDHFKGGKIKTLTKKDFDSSFNLKKAPGKNSLIVFHMPWCGFCVQLAPEYKKISTKVYSINGELPGNGEIFKHFKITGFPTIRFVSKNGVISNSTYTGNRDVNSMLEYIKEFSNQTGGGKLQKLKKVVKKPKKKVIKKKVIKKKVVKKSKK
jgi:thioredoxin-related protein